MVIDYVVLAGLLGFCSVVQTQDTIPLNCDPRVSNRFDACPAGYCCVRDEFLPSWVYCKKLGALREGCTTLETETNCPCTEGLHCQPNIVSSTGMASLYGKCALVTTTTGATTTTVSSASTTAGPVVSESSAATTAVPDEDSTPCPHGHSCEHHGHHVTHGQHGHHTADPIVG